MTSLKGFRLWNGRLTSHSKCKLFLIFEKDREAGELTTHRLPEDPPQQVPVPSFTNRHPCGSMLFQALGTEMQERVMIEAVGRP